MKYRFWVKNSLAIALLLPLMSQQASPGWTTNPVYQLAQKESEYTRLMRQGYKLSNQRNFRQAQKVFEQARTAARKLNAKSGSADRAIANITGYMNARKRTKITIVAGEPKRVGSAGTRGNCFQKQKPPIPLLPPVKEGVLTTQEYPTFYFYIPQITSETKAMEFVLRDDWRQDEDITPENIRPLYRVTFKPVSQPGIISIRIPSSSRPLQIDKQYTWGFSLVCAEDKRDEDLYTEGQIERIQDEDLTAELQQTQKTLDQAVLYTVGGIWENALSEIAFLKKERPDDSEIKEYWRELLESLSKLRKESQKLQELQESPELGDVDVLDAVDQPFLPCCSSEQAISKQTENK